MIFAGCVENIEKPGKNIVRRRYEKQSVQYWIRGQSELCGADNRVILYYLEYNAIDFCNKVLYSLFSGCTMTNLYYNINFFYEKFLNSNILKKYAPI